MQMTRREMLISAAALGLTGGTTDRWKEISAFLEAEQAAGVVPGATLVVSQNGKRMLERFQGSYCSLGRRDVALNEKVLHPLYSYSKFVSATVVMMAASIGPNIPPRW